MITTKLVILENMANVDYPYCQKCEYHPSKKMNLTLSQFSAISGKAQRGIDKKTGQFRMKITYPKDMQRDVLVQTTPRYIVTKPSEWRSSSRRIYKTKEKTSKVYPELKRNDEVSLIGLIQEEGPVLPVIMHNSSVGIYSIFVDEAIKLKKGVFSSFTIKNPILIAAEQLMDNLHESIK